MRGGRGRLHQGRAQGGTPRRSGGQGQPGGKALPIVSRATSDGSYEMYTGRSLSLLVLVLSLVGGFVIPTLAQAQAGFYVTPSLTFSQVYDDNLFSAPSGRDTERDIISRFSPGIQAGYQSTPLTLLARYGFDAEVFPDHPDLTTAQARQRASIDFRYLPTPFLTLSLTSAYTETETPGELNVQTALEGGRGHALSYSFNPSIGYQFDSFTGGRIGYTFTRGEQSGGVASDTHIANLGLDRRITSWDSLGLDYILRYFAFDNEDTTTSHAFPLGWTRQLTSLTSIALRAGPRFSEDSVDVEASASITHRLEHGQVSFTYSRSQNTVSGQAGAVDTDSFTGTATYQLLRFLQVSAEPSFSRSTRADAQAKVYRVTLNAAYQIRQWLSLQGSYQFSLQQAESDFLRDRSGRGGEDIYHNIFLLSLAMTYPYRLYQ